MLLEPFLAYCTLIFFFLWWCEKLRRVTLTDPSSTNLPYQFFLFFLCPLFTGRGTATSCKRWSVSNPMENLTQNSFLEKYKKKDVGNYNSFFFYNHILGIIDGKKNIREHTYIFSCRALITCSSRMQCFHISLTLQLQLLETKCDDAAVKTQMTFKSSRWNSDYFEIHLMPHKPLPLHWLHLPLCLSAVKLPVHIS